jgi:integrase
VPRKRQMTWQEGSKNRGGRWRKKIKGRVFHAPGGRGKHDEDAYGDAWDGFLEFKKRIIEEEAQKPKPHQAEYDEAISEWNLVLQWSMENTDTQYASLARRKVEELTNRLERSKPQPLTPADRFGSHLGWPAYIIESVAAAIPKLPQSADQSPSLIIDPSTLDISSMDGTSQRIEREIWQDRLQVQEKKQVEELDTLGTSVGSYLATKLAKVKAGDLSAGRYDPIRTHLYHFREWLGSETAVSSISGKALTDYHAELLTAISEERLSADYAKGRLGTVKSFVQWLWRVNAIEALPRVLAPGNNDLRISRKISTPEVFTIEEVKNLLASATDRTKLYLLLMLNTGSTQKDLSDMLPTEVDWKKGTITRKRSKTANHKGVPTVTYVLWKETFRLLQQERSSDAATVLVNHEGCPLKVERIDDEGKLKKIDNVASAFARLKRKNGIRKPLKYFRKTSATLLKSNKDYRGLDVLFLGHAPATVAERHYTQAPQQLLNEALAWLGQQYGIE